MEPSAPERDPETLWGPLLLLFTRSARGGDIDDALRDALLGDLAAHRSVAPLLRLAALALRHAGRDGHRRLELPQPAAGPL